jgi:hypothetical protein
MDHYDIRTTLELTTNRNLRRFAFAALPESLVFVSTPEIHGIQQRIV